MADVTLTYKGSTIAEMDASGSKTLNTAGKYCEGDIGVSYVKPSGGGSGVDIPDSAFVLSGNMNYWDYNGKWDSFIAAYADKWSTSNITDASYMFQWTSLDQIPFEINLGNTINFRGVFSNSNLTTLPTIIGNNVVVDGIRDFLSYNKKIKNIPDNYFNFIGDVDNYASISDMFTGCRSLRNFPSSVNILSQKYNRSNASSSLYSLMCLDCCVLDEITNLGVSTLITFTQNAFGSVAADCYRLKNFTFEPDKIVNWKNQTIDLTSVGYGLYDDYALSADIPTSKKVYDDATYQALKNDPDWYAFKVEYSRYNHDSAVATINSLPDASAYLATAGGTNTIKFKGAAGSATDGGAINTLTEEEIAVATAKGWSVSLV